MKTRIITTAVALFAFAFSQAQETVEVVEVVEVESAKGVSFYPGDIFVEGGISFSTDSDDNNSYGINPKAGYFLSNVFAVGIDLDFAGSTIKATDAKRNVFGVGAFARYYFLTADSKRFKAYADAGLGYSNVNEKGNIVGGGTYDNTTNGIKANISLGVNYFFTQHLAATFTLADILEYNNASPEDGDSSNSFAVNINLFNNIFAQPKFGLLYKF